MMGHRQVEQAALFYEFSLERHIPTDHLLRSIDRFVDLEQVRQELAPFYSNIGRPSIDPELMIRMLLIGYCFGIRSERRLCDEVFRAKRSDRVKIVVWDGSGLVLYWKRLGGSGFKWPPIVAGVMRMNAAQLAALLAGMDWTRMHAPRIPQPKALA